MPTSPADLLIDLSPLPRLRDPGTRRAFLDSYLKKFNKRAIDLAGQLRSGKIGIDAWQLAMRNEIRDLHRSALILSRGGEHGAITFSEWGRLGRYLRQQYGYLNRYAQWVQTQAAGALVGGKFPSQKYLEWRSQLYGGSARASFYRGMAMGLLPQYPGDGQTECRTNCACELRFEEGDVPGVLLVFWELRPAEHCPDCVLLSQEWNPYELVLPVGISAEDWVLWLPRMKAHLPVVA